MLRTLRASRDPLWTWLALETPRIGVLGAGPPPSERIAPPPTPGSTDHEAGSRGIGRARSRGLGYRSIDRASPCRLGPQGDSGKVPANFEGVA